MLIRTRQTHVYVAEYAKQLGLADDYVNNPLQEVSGVAMSFIANRLVSLRLAPARHPIAGETRWELLGRGLHACRQRGDLPPLLRLMYAVWFLLVAIVPQKGARWLAEQLLAPQASVSRRQRWLAGLRKERSLPMRANTGGHPLP
jgi:hypothetical protein